MSGDYKLTEGYPFDGAGVQVNIGPAPLAGGKRLGSGVEGARRRTSRRGGEDLMGARRHKLSRRGGQDSSSPPASPAKLPPSGGQDGARRHGGQPVPPSGGQDGARRSRRRGGQSVPPSGGQDGARRSRRRGGQDGARRRRH